MKAFDPVTIDLLKLFERFGPMDFEQVLTRRQSSTQGLDAKALRNRLQSMRYRGTLATYKEPGKYILTDYGRKAISDPSNGTVVTTGLHKVKDKYAEVMAKGAKTTHTQVGPTHSYTRVCNASMPNMQPGACSFAPPPRPGSNANLSLPSRVGNRLNFRDGTTKSFE